MSKRSPYEVDGRMLLVSSTQRTRKKRWEVLSDCEAEANKTWLDSVLHPRPNAPLQAETQCNECAGQMQPLVLEKQVPSTQMSVKVLEQKKILLPYLDKIEYINSQLRQRGLLPAEERHVVVEGRHRVTATSSQASQASRFESIVKPPSQALSTALTAQNQDEKHPEVSAQVLTRTLQTRYPRFYEAVVPMGSDKCLLPRRRGINWLLRFVEGVYNALSDILLSKIEETKKVKTFTASDTTAKGNNNSHNFMPAPGWLAMPCFTRRFIHHSLGLVELADQECMDLMYNIELACKVYPQVAMFAAFLRELFDHDTLIFFLFVRNHLQDEFDLDLAAKEKQAHSSRASGSKKYIATDMIELRNHPLIPDGTKQVFLSKAACEIVMQRVFDCTRQLCYDGTARIATPLLLARYVVRELLTSRLHASGSCSMVSAETFLTILVELFREVADDIVAQYKYNDDGESLTSLMRLRDTITLDSTIDKLIALYTEQERALRDQKIELMKMERSNTHSQFRVEKFLLRSQILVQEQELQHIQAKIIDGEKLMNNAWKEVVKTKSSSKQHHIGRDAKALSPSQELVPILGRFEAHIGRLQKKYSLTVKMSTLLAVPWQQQLEKLKVRMVVRIQRAYRARKHIQRAKQQVRDKLSVEIREREMIQKSQELEHKRVQAVQDRKTKQHQRRLEIKKTQDEQQKRNLQARQTNLVWRARKEEATQRATAKKKVKLVDVLTQWKAFLMKKKKRQRAHLLFLKFKFFKWKRHFNRHKRRTRAARAIQHCVRAHKRQIQLRKLFNLRAKRLKLAMKHVLNIHLQDFFNHWVQVTIELRLRDNVALMLQKRQSQWCQRWIRFVAMRKTRKRESASLIQRQYRGRIARQVFRFQRDRHRKAVTIQRVYRGHQGRKLARQQKEIKSGVEAILHRVRNREVRLCFSMIIRFTVWERRIKEMDQTRRVATERTMLHAWRDFCVLKIEKRAARLRLFHQSAVVIQRAYCHYRCPQMYKEILRNHRAAIGIQRVFRGYRGRQAAKHRRRQRSAALQVQTVWRRHKAKKYLVALRKEKILLAAYNGDYTTVKHAFANGVWDVVDAEGNSILHFAAMAGHKRLVKLCLRNSFDINVVNSRHQTALHLLLANLSSPNTAVEVSPVKASDERLELVEYMMKHGAWHEALDDEGFTPLLLCAFLGQSKAVDMLLNHGANTEARTFAGRLNALQLAVESNHSTTLEVLLRSRNFDRGESGRTTTFLLHSCAERGLLDCIRVLIAHIRQRLDVFGSDVLNSRDAEGNTALIYAVSNGYVDVTECLLAADADPDVKDFFGRSSLHFALLGNDAATREALVNLLVQYDADVTLKDTDGDTPLHVSCQADELLTCTHLLLTTGALISGNALGNHPTHIAACNGAINTLKLLLDYGGDMNVKNYDGKTPLGMARMNNQQVIVDFVSASFVQEYVDQKGTDGSKLLLAAAGSNWSHHERQKNQQHNLRVQWAADDEFERHWTIAEWQTAVLEGFCMGSIAEWTQYIDARTELPFYYCIGATGEHVYTWDMPIEFHAAMGDSWEIVRGPLTKTVVNLNDNEQDSSSTSKDHATYLYHNRRTDEVTSTTPPIDHALLQDVVQHTKRIKLLRARVRKISANERNTSTIEYMQYLHGFKHESAQMRKEFRAAIKIQRHFRARRTRLLIKALIHHNSCAVHLQRVFRVRKARQEMKWRQQQQTEIVKIQAASRGFLTRQRETRGLRSQRQLHLKRRLAAREIQRVFRGYMDRKRSYREKVIQRLGPKDYFQWEALRKRASVVESFKVWDAMEAQRDFPGVLFYSHQATRSCSWQKPSLWLEHDDECRENRRQMMRWGYTKRMEQAAQTLQTLWRARIARISFQRVLRAVRLMRTCEREYLEDPTQVVKLGNYALYLHTIVHDYDRARPLYIRLMQAMAQRGPDISFVLLSYGLFLYVTQENDILFVEDMIRRGKLADPSLVKYKVAFVGFFRQAVLQSPNDAEAHINYAACLHWLYEQYDKATTHYLLALSLAPQRKGLMEIFQHMLNRRRRRGKALPDMESDAFTLFRRWQSQQVEKEEQTRRMALETELNAAKRQEAASKIQARYRRRYAMRKVTRLTNCP